MSGKSNKTGMIHITIVIKILRCKTFVCAVHRYKYHIYDSYIVLLKQCNLSSKILLNDLEMKPEI
jgi:hypothetical protein